MSELTVARWEFAATTSFHFLFVLLTLGLVTLVAILQTRYAFTKNPEHLRQVRFWGQLYVVNYLVGIASGVLMEFQLGLNWAGLNKLVGGVFGAPLTMETLVAFFIESTLLGIWIFGWDRIGRVAHTVVIWLVCVTAYLSAFWVLVANSFLHHPVGYAIQGDVGILTDFGALLTNPNLWLAFPHVASAGIMVGAWFMIGVSTWHLRRGRDREFFLPTLRFALPIATLAAGAQIYTGVRQFHVFTLIPAKAAMWHESPVEMAKVQADLSAQYGPGNYLPPDWIHWAGDTMLYIGIVLAAVGLVASLFLFRDRLLRWSWPLRLLTYLMFLPFLAAIAGWVWREVGRQPWVVYGVLKTDQAISGVGATTVGVSFAIFAVLFAFLGGLDWILLTRLAKRGPGWTFWSVPSDDSGIEPVRDDLEMVTL
ncbi:cytochrome ubiquinol oxidase subunit I [Fodinicola feengrottensis]